MAFSTQANIANIISAHLDGCLDYVHKPKPQARGKVRDIFYKNDLIYLVVTDRISAFDQVLCTIPLKGALLCEQTAFWFNDTKDICPNHFLERLDHQILLCKKAQPLPIEVIVRAYLAGSLAREDKFSRGAAYGLKLDPEIKIFEKLAKPIITPTTKAPLGAHDEAISPQQIIAKNLVSKANWQKIENQALDLFNKASSLALKNGLFLVDTKYEFGLIDDQIYLIDEVHTSDSSRFFMVDDYGQKMAQNLAPTMLDKEYFRLHLINSGLDLKQPDLKNFAIDDFVRTEVAKRYFTLTEIITGLPFVAPTECANTRVVNKLSQLFC